MLLRPHLILLLSHQSNQRRAFTLRFRVLRQLDRRIRADELGEELEHLLLDAIDLRYRLVDRLPEILAVEVHDYRYNAGRSRDVHRSDDKGAHWSTASITFEIVDRPWIEHFGRKRVYVVAKGSFQFGVPYLWISNDGGRSFPNPPIPIVVYETGVVPREAGGTEPTPLDLVISGPGAYMDHMVVDPRTGDLYVLNGPPGLPLERHRAGWPRIRRLRLGGPATGRGNGVSVLVLRQTGGPRHGRGAPS